MTLSHGISHEKRCVAMEVINVNKEVSSSVSIPVSYQLVDHYSDFVLCPAGAVATVGSAAIFTDG